MTWRVCKNSKHCKCVIEKRWRCEIWALLWHQLKDSGLLRYQKAVLRYKLPCGDFACLYLEKVLWNSAILLRIVRNHVCLTVVECSVVTLLKECNVPCVAKVERTLIQKCERYFTVDPMGSWSGLRKSVTDGRNWMASCKTLNIGQVRWAFGFGLLHL
jgi:hypothetical protein